MKLLSGALALAILQPISQSFVRTNNPVNVAFKSISGKITHTAIFILPVAKISADVNQNKVLRFPQSSS